jgi:hypothetical protein
MGKIQNETDSLVEQYRKEQIEKEQLAYSILNQRDEKIDSVVEQYKKEQLDKENLASSILNQKEANISALIEKTQANYTQEELNYMESAYYSNYQKTKEYIKNNKNMIETYLNQLYIQNYQFYKNPFAKEIKCALTVNEIGCPIPKRFEDEIIDLLKNELGISNFDDAQYNIEMQPLEYSKGSENMIKQTKGYRIIVSLNQKNLEPKSK